MSQQNKNGTVTKYSDWLWEKNVPKQNEMCYPVSVADLHEEMCCSVGETMSNFTDWNNALRTLVGTHGVVTSLVDKIESAVVNGVPDNMLNVTPEHKNVWVQLGVIWETWFLSLCRKHGTNHSGFMRMNADKLKRNAYGIDMEIHTLSGGISEWVPLELKYAQTPFFLSESKYGIPPRFAYTFDVKDELHYKALGREFYLVIFIDYPEFYGFGQSIKPLRDIYLTTWSALNVLIQDAIRTNRIHTYKNRVNDQIGNGRQSYILDVRNLIPMTFEFNDMNPWWDRIPI